MTTKTKTQRPKKVGRILSAIPSEAIRAVIAALQRFEKDKNYVVDPTTWVLLRTWDLPKPGPCHLGVAGAAMVGLCGLQPTGAHNPKEFEPVVAGRLFGLEDFALGKLHKGLHWWGCPVPESLPDRVEVTRYGINKDAFYRDFQKVAEQLEPFGL